MEILYQVEGRSFSVREFLRQLDEVCDKFNVSLIANMDEGGSWMDVVDIDTDETICQFV